MAKQLTHTHQITVESDEENVTVMIGGDGGVPGGFAKLFNRVIDSQAWARLSDAGRAAYLPMVRFADQRNHFRIQIGQAGLMKYSGLSRSSVKRAMKDLLASKLIVLVEQGGVTADGQNESNLYQLMVPTEAKARPVVGGAGVGPAANPFPVPTRTPSQPAVEPPAGPAMNRVAVRPLAASPVQSDLAPRSANGPQFRRNISEDSRHVSPDALPRPARLTHPGEDAAVLLEEKGVEPAAARELAQVYPFERVVDVVATMEYRKAHGKCDNPGGFIREALVKQWQTPRAVTDARRAAEAKLREQAADRSAREARLAEGARVNDDEARVERLIDGLEDDELSILADSVIGKYAGNAAVLQVLTRKPPRQCRLMKMEIAGMLAGGR